MGFLALLAPLLSGLFQPIKDYIAYKSQKIQADRELELAKITADKEAIVASANADSADLSARLSSTEKTFKQNTFWLLCIPVLLSICFPSKAQVMWHNFSLIPQWFQWLFIAVYSSIWGIPVAKGGYGTIVDLLARRTEGQVSKIQALNEAAIAASLRQTLFKQGMTESQWQAIQKAIHAGEVE